MHGLHKTLTKGEPKPRSATNLFCGEKRIEYFCQIFRRNPNAGVAYLDQYIRIDSSRTQRQPPAHGHRIYRIGCQSDHGLLQMACVAGDNHCIVRRLHNDLYIISTVLVSNQPCSCVDHIRDIDARVPPGAGATKIKKSIRDCFAAEGFVAN